MRVVVTGGSGFIGSHIVDALDVDGYDVFNIDWLQFGENGSHHADLKENVLALTTKDLLGADVVVHCAAHADVSRNWDSYTERAACFRQNVECTLQLLECAPPKAHIIFLSTCAIYGDSRDGAESINYRSTSPYAASKLAAEKIVESFAEARKNPYHIFRLGCVVGSRYHHGHVADFVRMAKLGHLRPKNHGSAYKSFVHVLDVVDAVRMAFQKPVNSGVYNCVSDSWSPRDTVRVMGCEAEWPDNYRGWVGDPMAIASGEKFRTMFGLKARTVESGVRDALTSLGWP